jgi:Uma2 family endonuclease
MTPFSPPLDAEALRAMYPESDGKPMSDNTVQARWIFLLYGNLCALLRGNDRAFVAADNLWYPVEKQPKVRVAPDVYVVFGRPKGDRGSYMQWLEDGIPLTVAFEVLSPRNSKKEMAKKLRFYDRHGVEEYYVYDPDANTLEIRTRAGGRLSRYRSIPAFVSPRLGIRFEMTRPEMTVFGPNGVRFRTFEELQAQYEEEKEAREDAQRRADEARQLAESRGKRADDATKRADDATKRADDATKRADDATKRADDNARRAARLADLGRKVRRGQATPEEVAELERLEEETA